ncbi:MAG: hypothetical protein ACYSUI_26000, partial [Planctomycetota bacterium]
RLAASRQERETYDSCHLTTGGGQRMTFLRVIRFCRSVARDAVGQRPRAAALPTGDVENTIRSPQRGRDQHAPTGGSLCRSN